MLEHLREKENYINKRQSWSMWLVRTNIFIPMVFFCASYNFTNISSCLTISSLLISSWSPVSKGVFQVILGDFSRVETFWKLLLSLCIPFLPLFHVSLKHETKIDFPSLLFYQSELIIFFKWEYYPPFTLKWENRDFFS